MQSVVGPVGGAATATVIKDTLRRAGTSEYSDWF